MTDKHKTPEELAEEAFNAIPLVDTIKKAAPKVHETSLFWFTAGFEAGYEAARPKWISVKERLPEMYKEVLCVLSDRYEMVASMVPDDTWTDPEGREYEQKRFVIVFTHWQPLPAAPKDL